MSKKKLLLLGATVIIAVAIVITGTFAWFSTEQVRLNILGTKDTTAGLELVENFEEEKAKELEPGLAVEKEVRVVQTGDGAAIARVRLEELFSMYEADGNASKEYWLTEGKNGDVVNASAANEGKLVASTITEKALLAKLAAGGYDNTGATLADYTTLTNADYTVLTGTTAMVFVKTETKVEGTVTKTTKNFFAVAPVGAEYQVVSLTKDATKGYADPAFFTAVDFLYKNKLNPVFNVFAPSSKGAYHYDGTDGAVILAFGAADTAIDTYFSTNFAPIASYAADYTASASDPTKIQKWYYDADGWAYYGDVIREGESSNLLLEKVQIASQAKNEYQGIDYLINVRMQGLQPTLTAVKAEWNSGSAIKELYTDGVSFELAEGSASHTVPSGNAMLKNTVSADALAMMALLLPGT